MVYTFICPAPCSKVIMVDATNDDDAVNKLIRAGAINCRNIKKSSFCNKNPHLCPFTEKELQGIVRLCMTVEDQ